MQRGFLFVQYNANQTSADITPFPKVDPTILMIMKEKCDNKFAKFNRVSDMNQNR